jgi:hypothetical protein
MKEDAGNQPSNRSLLQRQLDALADWLAKDHWTVEQAACLLVGVLPDNDRQKWLPDGEARRGYGACLPGRESWPDAESWHWHVLAEIEEMERRLAATAKFGKVARDATLKLAVEASDLPPWWSVAKGDSACAMFLPVENIREESEISTSPVMPQDRMQSKGGRKAAEVNFPNREEQMKFVLEKIKEGRNNKRILDLLAKEFSDAYLTAAEEKWIPDMRKKTGIRRGSTSG